MGSGSRVWPRAGRCAQWDRTVVNRDMTAELLGRRRKKWECGRYNGALASEGVAKITPERAAGE